MWRVREFGSWPLTSVLCIHVMGNCLHAQRHDAHTGELVAQQSYLCSQLPRDPSNPCVLRPAEVKCRSVSRAPLWVAPWMEAHQAPLSVQFCRQEHWSVLPFPSWDLPDPGIGPRPPAFAGRFFTM